MLVNPTILGIWIFWGNPGGGCLWMLERFQYCRKYKGVSERLNTGLRSG